MWLLPIVIALSCIFIGVLTFIRNTKSVENRYFFALNIFSAIWVLSNYFEVNDSAALAKFLLNIDFASGFILSELLFLFSLTFTCQLRDKNLKIANVVLGILSSAIIYLIFFTGLIIEGIDFSQNGLDVQSGKLFIVYASLILINTFASLAVFISGYMKSNKRVKLQIQFISLGIFLEALILILTNLVIPRISSSPLAISFIPRLGYAGLVIFLGFTAYAIAKHRLMDIRLIAVRSISFSLLLFVLISGFALPLYKLMFWATENGVGTMGQIAIGATAAIIIGTLIPYIRKRLTKATDAVFFKQEYDTEKFQKEINNILSSNIILSELLHKTMDYVIKEFRLFQGMFVVAEGDKVYTVQSIGYKKAPEVAFKDVKSLSRFPILVYDELEEGSRAKNILRKYEVAIAVPLIEEHQFAGVLLLGDKKSGDMFSSKDISTLEIIAPEIAMAMQRAKQYEEIQKFNQTLKAEVIRQTRRLKEANEHLKELDHAKDEFISMASHQLRTPLTAIKGYLSMLLEGDAGEIKVGQYDFIDEAFKGSNKMVALISDLLNISRMSTGKFFIDPKEIDMKALINDEVHQLADPARQKGLYLKFEHPKVMPIVEADENKIRQVIMNFIDNAIYYTNGGGITVKAMANSHDFVFEVHDTGIGVPSEVQSKLFTKFYRADNAKKLRPDGSGLGLYLAKRVIEDHGGEIIFRSSSKGSVFGFRIPIKSKIKVASKKRLIAA